ncbi:uncharacterized protein LOC132601514 [Lycium barbarum]|uniref:uncharacterized protein LOC132601514 n=1 Tax=Lycium barbarum TaxID=112863 RepID=UPI00293E1E3D|nr:uncharacterized protein LOC132601514 [Lycium barbarum]
MIESEGVLRIKGRVCVPRVEDLIKTILEESHSSRYFIYPGATKMYPDLRQHYWWGRIRRDITDFVGRATLGKCDSVWVIVDWFTKSAHFIPVRVTYTTEKLAQIYICKVVHLHGVTISIISDTSPQFMSRFWRTLQAELGTRLDLNIDFHPQIDDQSEQRSTIITISKIDNFVSNCIKAGADK